MKNPRLASNSVQKVKPVSELKLYLRVLVFGLGIFALSYFYLTTQKIPNLLNKSVADTAIILIGLSMALSGICYFWNFFDSKIIYRKHLGLIGFAFGIIHIGLSFSTLERLLQIETWEKGTYWPALTGLLATLIFTAMALVSNRFSATKLGGKLWRSVLHTGYLGMLLILAHVVILKSARWITWYTGGMKTLPSLSLIVSIFIVVVILVRISLWWSLKRNAKRT